MTRKLLIANRGEIAVRIARAAADLDIATVAVHPADDERALHTRVADQAVALEGRGAAAYLDAEQLVRVAVETGCDAVHPGYGFLSESRDFAERCQQAGLTFVGPTPEVLALLVDGEAWSSSALAMALGVSSRSVQRKLEDLALAGKVRSFGRGRACRWILSSVPGFPTSLLLPLAITTG